MAFICKRCGANVTEDYEAAPVKWPFRCKCGSKVFIDQPDPPKVPYELNANDRKFLKGCRIGTEKK